MFLPAQLISGRSRLSCPRIRWLIARAAWLSSPANTREPCVSTPEVLVLAVLHRLRTGKIRLGTIVVDLVGVGYTFALHLVDNGFNCYGFNAGARAIEATQFLNQKAESHWTFRSHLHENLISGLTDEETAAQLSTIRYLENSRGLTEIEVKRRGTSAGYPGARIAPNL